MANYCHRLAGIKKFADKADGLFIHPKLVRICHAAGQQKCIKISRICISKLHIDIELVALVKMFPAFHLAIGGRDYLGGRTCFFQCNTRIRKLYLLEAIGHQNCYSYVCKNFIHIFPPGRVLPLIVLY